MLSNKERFMNGLGMCRRAGKVVYGDKLLALIQSKEVYLVIITEDASKRTQKQLYDKAKHANVKIVDGLTSSELSYAMGMTHCVAAGITDAQLVKVLKKHIQKEEVTVSE